VSASGSETNGQAGSSAAGGGRSQSMPGPGPARVGASFGASSRIEGHRDAGGAELADLTAASRPDGADATDAAGARDGDHTPPERTVREHGGAEDFRAVAPPVMSFAQGRRR
jgi:hypothetical protein